MNPSSTGPALTFDETLRLAAFLISRGHLLAAHEILASAVSAVVVDVCAANAKATS